MRGVAWMLSLVLSAAAVTPAVRARGDEPPPAEAAETKLTPNQQKAEGHYKRARELYQLGRYREAIAQLEAALKLDPSGAELLYNLGLIHEKLGDVDEAIDGYRRYLNVLGKDADPEELAKINGFIKRLEGAKTELRARESKKTEHRFTALSAGLMVGAGVGALAAGVFGVAALRHDADARGFVVRDAGGLDKRQALIDRSRSEANFANVFGAVTALAVAGGLTLYFLSEFPKKDELSDAPRSKAALHLAPLPNGGSVGLEVAF